MAADNDIIYVREEQVRIRTANPGWKDRIWEALSGPKFVRIRTAVYKDQVVDLVSSKDESGREVFIVAEAGSDSQRDAGQDDPIDDIIELFREHLRSSNWQEIEQLGNSLLRDYRGQPGGMHNAAMSSRSVGVLSDLLISFAQISERAGVSSQISAVLRQAYRDLAIEG